MAETVPLAAEPRSGDVCSRLRESMPSRPSLLLGVALMVLALLSALAGARPTAQATLNGLAAGSYLGLGAIGLTLIAGILRIVNFAQGDLLVTGTYLTILFGGLGAPMPLAMLAGILGTAVVALGTEMLIWRPLRESGAGTLQLFLSAIGLAFVLRYTIQFFGGSQVRSLNLDVVSSVTLGPLRLGTQQAGALVVGLAAMAITGGVLRYTALGKDMRAFADNPSLAEVSGIDTRWIITITWIGAGLLAGLAGLLYAASIGSINPNFGATLLLGLFAAAILGGIGNAYGALVGGLVIGLSQEWATLLVNARWKPAVGFAILILTLLFMPNGIFGRVRRRS